MNNSMSERVDLTPVDGVEVTFVMDNAADILAAPTESALRPSWGWDWSDVEQLRAEHGYSLPGRILKPLTPATGAGRVSIMAPSMSDKVDLTLVDGVEMTNLAQNHPDPVLTRNEIAIADYFNNSDSPTSFPPWAPREICSRR
jgi:hypothetical protein